QVRLRDIGGIIVCDFIDMNTEGARNRVVASLESVLRKDRTRATIQSFSALGLLEFTRKRVGKDLGAQLRGACPTCSGLGSVLSPQSTAIETFRKIRLGHQQNGGHTHPIVVDTFPTVAAQLEYWYEDEVKGLAAEIKQPIHVRVDALLHPERTKVHALANGAKTLEPNLRVGDEHEVDLLNVRLPNQTSAVTVLDNQLVEIENAANMAGQTIRIRILDVDEDGVLAEPLGAVVPASAEGKKKRRRRGGRKAPLTADEQAQQLRELAEEAAKGAAGRPVAIGISTEAEAEDEEAQDKTRVAAPVAIGVEPGKPVADLQQFDADGTHRKRRRRRRRGRGGLADSVQPGMPQEGAAAQAVGRPDVEDDEDEAAPAASVAPAARPSFETAADAEGDIRRKRRRRRRRGRGDRPEGFEPVAASPNGTGAPVPAPARDVPVSPVPDRHIFRVNADGGAESTGRTAPREPSRSIAPWNRRPAPPAVEPPPPSLRVPEETTQVTKPARRRRTGNVPARVVGGELQASPVVALPSPQDAAKPKRGRKKAEAVAAPAEKPKRPRKVAPPASAAAEKAKPARKSSTAVARKKTSPTKTTATRKKK
nr:ribonuclease E/G [Candidatus Eremiobacteraeota bacterium]